MRILKFEKNDCAPCKMVEQFLESHGVANEVEHINAYDDPDKAYDHGISTVPVTLLLDEQGVETERVIGFDREKLKALVSRYQNKQ